MACKNCLHNNVCRDRRLYEEDTIISCPEFMDNCITHGKGTLKNAIYTYGMETQLNVCIEELSELIKEICKLKRGKGNLVNLAEEMADVKIILQELDIMFSNGEAVDEWINKKIERLKATLETDKQKA